MEENSQPATHARVVDIAFRLLVRINVGGAHAGRRFNDWLSLGPDFPTVLPYSSCPSDGTRSWVNRNRGGHSFGNRLLRLGGCGQGDEQKR